MYIDWFNVGSYINPEYLIPINYIDKKNEFNSFERKTLHKVYSSEYFFVINILI